MIPKKRIFYHKAIEVCKYKCLSPIKRVRPHFKDVNYFTHELDTVKSF